MGGQLVARVAIDGTAEGTLGDAQAVVVDDRFEIDGGQLPQLLQQRSAAATAAVGQPVALQALAVETAEDGVAQGGDATGVEMGADAFEGRDVALELGENRFRRPRERRDTDCASPTDSTVRCPPRATPSSALSATAGTGAGTSWPSPVGASPSPSTRT